MAYRILEANNVDIENVDGAAFNNFAAMNQSGVIGGVLKECSITASGSTVFVSSGCLLIHGIRVKISDLQYVFSSTPASNQDYQLIAQIELGDNNSVSFSFYARVPADLVQDNLFVAGQGIYQLEIGKCTYRTDGTLTNVVRTVPILSGDGLIIEQHTVQVTEWQALSTEKDPYTFAANFTTQHTINARSIIELYNDNPVLFAKYGFAINAVNEQTVTVYSIGKPESVITLMLGIMR